MEGGKSSEERWGDLGTPVQAAYEVVIDSPVGASRSDDRPADWQVLGVLEELRPGIADELTKRAIQRFGPGHHVVVTHGWTGGSVHTLALLAVRYSVRAVVGAVDELRRFAGEIEVVIAEALERESTVSFQVVAEVDEQSLPAPEPASEEKDGWDRIAPVLAAIGTGIGVLGFVTFVGGAINWARFQAAGLPQEQALSVIPTQDLIVVGARTLVPAITWGLLACAFYGLISALLGTRAQRASSPKSLQLAEAHGPTVRAAFLAFMVLGFEIGVSITDLTSLSPWRAIVLIGVGLMAPLLTFVIAKRSERFLYLAPTIFLALSVFLGVAAYVRALDIPELRPAAIVRENQKALFGFFVAESSSRVYLARLDPGELREGKVNRKSARLIGIAKDEISSIEVGSPKPPAAAVRQADALAEELCREEIPRPVNKEVPKRIQRCWSRLPGR